MPLIWWAGCIHRRSRILLIYQSVYYSQLKDRVIIFQFYILGACRYCLAGGGIVSCIVLGVYHLYYGLLRTDDRA